MIKPWVEYKAGSVGFESYTYWIISLDMFLHLFKLTVREKEFILRSEVFILILTLLEILWRLSEEPLLLLMSVVSVVTLLLMVRVFLKRGSAAGRDVAEPLETIADDEEQTLEETIATPEISPVIIDGEIDVATRAIIKAEDVIAEIRPLLSPEKPDECEYCSIFKDLATVVCPNCGRPLNLPRGHEE